MKDEDKKHESEDDMDYTFNNAPPWSISIVLGIQHFLTMCTGNAIATILVADSLCLQKHSSIKSELISSSFFVMGIASLLQTICGCKLPVIQGASFACIIPTIKLLSMPNIKSCNFSENQMAQDMFLNSSSPESLPLLKLRLMNGAIMASSIVEIIISISGLLGVLTKLISPLSLAAIYTVLSINISETLLNMMAQQWAIGIIGMVLSTVTIVILAPIPIPIPTGRSDGKWKFSKIRIFQICPVILALGVLWILCAILTVSGLLSSNPKGWGYSARTDTKFQAIYDARIIKVPYPIQWGTPLLIPSAIIGIAAGIVLSTIESVGDYMITASICKAPKVPQFAINRGIFIEGIGVFLSGFLGAVSCPTSYSGNIGLMKITKAGNVRIGQVTAFIMILFGIFPVFGALFVSIPDPAVGGVLFIVCLLVLGCAINNFQYIDMYSTRNIVVYGFSVSFGLTFPTWCSSHLDLLTVGYQPIDEVIHILLTIHLFIAAVTAIFLDNVLPGYYYGEKDKAISICGTECVKAYTEFERHLAFDLKILKWLAIKCQCLQFLPLFPAYRNLKESIYHEDNNVDDDKNKNIENTFTEL